MTINPKNAPTIDRTEAFAPVNAPATRAQRFLFLLGLLLPLAALAV